jgi:regulator of sigma E protease
MSQALTFVLSVLAVPAMFMLLIGPHEAGHFLFAKLFKVRVIEFSIGAGTMLWSVTRGGTLYAIRLIPILGYVRMGGMEAGDFEEPNGFHSKPAWQRIVILVGGPAANFLFAILLITGFLLTQVNTDPGKVFKVVPGTPAAAAGLQPGDSIRSVNGKPYDVPNVLRQEERADPVAVAEKRAAPGLPLTLAGVHADGRPFSYTLTPNCSENGQCQVGVSLPQVLISPQDAISTGVKFPIVTIKGTVKGMWALITGEIPGGLTGPQGLMGPVGIADVAVQSVSQGPPFFIYIVALLSVALGFTNLLPLLALDGGRIVVVIIEWLRRKPFDRNAEMNFQRWGLVVLLGLLMVITFVDIQRIATGQFPVIK